MEGVSRKFNSWVDNKDLKLNQVLNRESKQFGPHPNRLRSCVWTLSKMSLDPIQKLTYNKGHFQKSKTHQEMRLSLNFSKSRAKFKTVFAQNRLVNNQFNEDFSKVFKPVIEQQKKKSKNIVSKFAPLQTAIENIPNVPALPWGLPQPEGAAESEGLQAAALPDLLYPLQLEQYLLAVAFLPLVRKFQIATPIPY